MTVRLAIINHHEKIACDRMTHTMYGVVGVKKGERVDVPRRWATPYYRLPGSLPRKQRAETEVFGTPNKKKMIDIPGAALCPMTSRRALCD